MFEGEKTWVFWIGLMIVTVAALAVFSILWYTVIANPSYYGFDSLRYLTPQIVGSVAFIFIGLYMMKSGVKKDQTKAQTKLL